MQTLDIRLEDLALDPANVRHIDAALDGLIASMRALGQLQPIVVRHAADDGPWRVTIGARRVAAARALEWKTIAATVWDETGCPESPAVASAAENMVRAAMHPVDQWRALAEMTADGALSIEGAAAALGIDARLARKLEHLGRMAPEVVDALAAERELPSAQTMRIIALAPHAVQVKGLETARKAQGRREELDWWRVGQVCTMTRIPRSRAIFDHAAIAWEEDLFAEPGADDQFTTADVEAFLAAQWEALNARAEASKGRITMIRTNAKAHQLRDMLPAGWLATYDPMPKRWKKDDPRKAFACVCEAGYDLGNIVWVVASSKPERGATSARNGHTDLDTAPAKERPPISKAVQRDLALIQAQAVRERLPLLAANENAADMLRALLLVLTLDNVAVPDTERQYGGKGPYKDLARLLVNPEGSPVDLTEGELCKIAAGAVARAVKFSAPDVWDGAGAGAHWLAHAVGAEMPRCDTDEILKGVSGDLLRDLAMSAGIDAGGKVGDVRKRLVGNLPDWQPVTFDKTGPGEVADDDETMDETPIAAEPGYSAGDGAEDEQEAA